MQIPSEFIFLRPWFLVLLPIGMVLAYFVVRRGGNSWNQICDTHLLTHLMMAGNKASTKLIRLVILTGWILAVFALAGPAWDREETTLFRSVDAIVIVFDLSLSMNSVDLPPSRLELARYKAIDIINSDHDKAVGLVVFAGNAFDVVAVSDDASTVAHLVQSLNTSMLPVQGSNASHGIARAENLLRGSGYDSGSVILLTDGIDGAAFDAARSLKQSGYSLSVIGVGTQYGAPIKLERGGYLKNEIGEIIVPQVDLDLLNELAVAGGGSFSLVSEEDSVVAAQGTQFALDVYAEDVESQVSTEKWKDRGPLILIFLIPVVAIMYRRGWLLAAVLILMIPQQESVAFDWADLWQRSDQQAANAVESGQYDDNSLSEQPEWNGIAHYRKKQFDQAADEFSKLPGKTGMYNKGNALAKLGDLAGAISMYESALAIDPDFEDAQFNLDIVKKLIESQKKKSGQEEFSQNSSAGQGNEQNKEKSGEGTTAHSNTGDQQEETGEGNLSQRSADQSKGGRELDEDQLNNLASQSKEQLLQQGQMDEETQQVMEQWLRRIPDDPGGLLRRRFAYENYLRKERTEVNQPW